MYLSVYLFSLVSTQEPLADLQDRFYQYVCMQKTLFKDVSTKTASPDKMSQYRDYCTSKNFRCKRGLIYALQSNANTNLKVTNLEWLPPTLRRVEVIHSNINTPLHTKKLPGDLRFLQASHCYLYGNISLAHLPDKMVEIHLRRNNFFGSVQLTQLPTGIEIIDLGYNTIEAVSWIESLLPISLKEAHLYSSQGEVEQRHIGKRPKVSTDALKFDHTMSGPPPISTDYYDDEL